METFDLIVIGSGPGGYVAAIRAAQLGLKTACIEKRKELGGTCLNVGCIPSKSLLQSSENYWNALHHSKEHGIDIATVGLNFAQMMQRKQKVVAGFNEGIAGLFKKNQVTRYTGTAKFLSPNTVQVDTTELTAKNILIATGSEPISLPFLPFDEKKILSSTGALSLEKIPKKMLVIGAGVIGVELGSVYQRLGSEVVFIEFLDRICPTLDESISKNLQQLLTAQGMTFHLSSKVTNANVSDSVTLQVSSADKGESQITGDVVLVCIGRRPYTQGLQLEKAGITLTPKGLIPVSGSFRTTTPHIYAIGDVIDGPMLAHKASEEGVAAVEIIAGQSPTIEYMAIPNVVYTEPEVAAVGLTEPEAKAFGLKIKTGVFSFKANSRARCSGSDDGFVKIISDEATDRLLGIHILGPHASELIAQSALAIQKKMTTLDLIHTPFAHPTLAEAIKEAALAVYKRPIHR